MSQPRQLSAATLRLVEQSEGLRLTAYRDTGGVWTIGYGHTRGVVPEQTCTQAEAEAWLREDLAVAVAAVSRLVTVPLNDGEFGALVDWVFNLGEQQVRTSTLIRLLNTDAPREQVALQFSRWVYDNGVVQPGLVTRRRHERQLFLTGDYGTTH